MRLEGDRLSPCRQNLRGAAWSRVTLAIVLGVSITAAHLYMRTSMLRVLFCHTGGGVPKDTQWSIQIDGGKMLESWGGVLNSRMSSLDLTA